MVNTEIRLIVFFAAKDGEALYSQQKQEQELTMAQIMNSFIAKFRLKLKKVGKTAVPFSYDHYCRVVKLASLKCLLACALFSAENNQVLKDSRRTLPLTS